jgi:hypothetical protein
VRARAPALTRWASLGLLLAAGGLLAYALGSALAYTATHSGPPCSNPPALAADPPQLVVVLFCVVAFAAGHLTARWQHVDPRHLAPTPADDKEEDEAEQRRRVRQMLLIQALLLVFLLEILALLVFEVVTLSSNQWPITFYVRCAYNAAGWPTTLAAASITFLLGRWLWLPRRWIAHPGA